MGGFSPTQNVRNFESCNIFLKIYLFYNKAKWKMWEQKRSNLFLGQMVNLGFLLWAHASQLSPLQYIFGHWNGRIIIHEYLLFYYTTLGIVNKKSRYCGFCHDIKKQVVFSTYMSSSTFKGHQRPKPVMETHSKSEFFNRLPDFCTLNICP